ncbi:hypothetical protein HPB51_015607 [Rhipicephalus microplus]|uniref:SAP domain-containing protein n=1 Tax=Rhipicephalus microplus TaxID=6941 RepID=A0A9J6DHJ3_RHIMP|nr:hypothetical protein HPB51_015607 [Rhipicephalus microplus]
MLLINWNEATVEDLHEITADIIRHELSGRNLETTGSKEDMIKRLLHDIAWNCQPPGSDQLASDHSDEEEDWWGHALDVPGFDNNVSASNTINSLMCFVLGEVVLHLSRSSDQAEKPYLMLRLEKLCADAALMEYGPAFQATISGIYLVDKLHIGATGEYLELLTSCATKDMVSIFYRKARHALQVKASCPEFKSDFHQVEHSVVVDFTSVIVTFHREALLTLGRYLLYVCQKLNVKDLGYAKVIPKFQLASALFKGDPPVPTGSTKMNITLHVHEVSARLCDVDVELSDIRVSKPENTSTKSKIRVGTTRNDRCSASMGAAIA